MVKNYYLILGVASDADMEAIKTAYRRRALELHPDRSGLESEPFLELQEAYGVLSDANRRRAYDQQRSLAARGRGRRSAAEPLVRGYSSPKPEAFRLNESSGIFDELVTSAPFTVFDPSLAELLERWWSDFG